MFSCKICTWIYPSVLIFLSVIAVIHCADNADLNEIEDDIFKIEDDQAAIRKRISELQNLVIDEIQETTNIESTRGKEDDDVTIIEPEDPASDPKITEFVKRLDNVEKNIEAIQSYVDGERETDTFLNGLRGDIGKAFDNDMLQVKNLAGGMRKELKESLEKAGHDLKAVEDFANSRNVIIGGVLYYDGIGSACGESFDVCRVENSECRDGKCQCKMGMSHDSLQEKCVDACADGYGNTYQTVHNYIIRGHNTVTVNETSLEDCKEQCETADNFECRSIDYFPRWEACYLSDVVKGDIDNEAWEYNSAGIHFQRDCIVDKQ